MTAAWVGSVDFDAGLAGAVEVHEEEAGGVPDFVGEGAVALGAGFGECDVGAGRGHAGQGEAHGIGAEALDDLDGVDDVALGLGHLLAVGVADEGVDVDLLEGDGFGELARAAIGHRDVEHEVAAEHDHAGDPEEEDVEAGDEQGGGVEGGEIGGEVRGSRFEVRGGRQMQGSFAALRMTILLCIAGPAEDGEGEQAGGEPGVEDVGLLRDLGGAAGGAGGGGLAGDGDGGAGGAVPCGDAMAPPELAGDAPVVDVVHPLDVGLGVHLGSEADVAVADGGDGFGGDGVSCNSTGARAPLVRAYSGG